MVSTLPSALTHNVNPKVRNVSCIQRGAARLYIHKTITHGHAYWFSWHFLKIMAQIIIRMPKVCKTNMKSRAWQTCVWSGWYGVIRGQDTYRRNVKESLNDSAPSWEPYSPDFIQSYHKSKFKHSYRCTVMYHCSLGTANTKYTGISEAFVGSGRKCHSIWPEFQLMV